MPSPQPSPTGRGSTLIPPNVSQRKDPPDFAPLRFIFNHSSSILSVNTPGSWKTNMKRTKTMNHASFRKSWNARHLTPVALAVTAVFMLAGCEQSDETVSLYQNADDCASATGKSAECTTAYNNALKEAERTDRKSTRLNSSHVK